MHVYLVKLKEGWIGSEYSLLEGHNLWSTHLRHYHDCNDDKRYKKDVYGEDRTQFKDILMIKRERWINIKKKSWK